jgi:hypothetical protein
VNEGRGDISSFFWKKNFREIFQLEFHSNEHFDSQQDTGDAIKELQDKLTKLQGALTKAEEGGKNTVKILKTKGSLRTALFVCLFVCYCFVWRRGWGTWTAVGKRW